MLSNTSFISPYSCGCFLFACFSREVVSRNCPRRCITTLVALSCVKCVFGRGAFSLGWGSRLVRGARSRPNVDDDGGAWVLEHWFGAMWRRLCARASQPTGQGVGAGFARAVSVFAFSLHGDCASAREDTPATRDRRATCAFNQPVAIPLRAAVCFGAPDPSPPHPAADRWWLSAEVATSTQQ